MICLFHKWIILQNTINKICLVCNKTQITHIFEDCKVDFKYCTKCKKLVFSLESRTKKHEFPLGTFDTEEKAKEEIQKNWRSSHENENNIQA